MSYALKAKNLKKHYRISKENTVKALAGVDLAVRSGEIVAIMGPSGSGKSTLLNMLGCLDKPTSGDVVVDNTDVSSLPKSKIPFIRNKKIGFIFQQFNLIPTLTAKENVMLPLKYAGLPKKQASKKAEDVLKQVGLTDRINHLTTQLSGGQQQRVAIARALITNPAIILADEPTGELDSANSQSILDLILKLNKKGHTFLIVTHNEEIAKLCSRTIRLKDGLIDLS